MKKLFITVLTFVAFQLNAQVKIGDNPTTISPSAALEIESTNKGLIVSRVANTAAITSPVNGMIIYDVSTQCIKFYQNNAWSDCISGGSSTQSILEQIGMEADDTNLPSTVLAQQLIELGITGVNPDYITAYQNYIDANPDADLQPAQLEGTA